MGHRGRSGDPLYLVRRTLRTRLALLTQRQRARLEAVFAAEEHVAVTVTWWTYKQIIAAYADHDRTTGKALLTLVIDRLRAELPTGLEELTTLGRTLHRRRPTRRWRQPSATKSSPATSIVRTRFLPSSTLRRLTPWPWAQHNERSRSSARRVTSRRVQDDAPSWRGGQG